MRTVTGRCLSVLCCAALLSGCGSDQKKGADPGSPTSSTTTPTSESSAPSKPTVEPATGERVALGSLVVNFPEGYAPRRTNAGVLGAKLASASGPDGQRVVFGTSKSPAPIDLDGLVAVAIESGFWAGKPKRLEDVTVAGVAMYHLRGRTDSGATEEEYGATFGGYDVVVSVETAGSGKERKDLIESVLATAEWR